VRVSSRFYILKFSGIILGFLVRTPLEVSKGSPAAEAINTDGMKNLRFSTEITLSPIKGTAVAYFCFGSLWLSGRRVEKTRTPLTYLQAQYKSQTLRVWICFCISVFDSSWNYQPDKSPHNRTPGNP